MVINKLSIIINGDQGLLMVISQLSMDGYWLSISYQSLSRVINKLSMIINGDQRLLMIISQ